MNTYLTIGTRVVILALMAYSAGIITEQIKKHVTNTVLAFISIGVLLDIFATAFMILGSSNSPFSLHGFIGYSSLAGMLTDAILLWRFRLKYGDTQIVNRALHLYSRIAYSWWVMAFITGGLLVLFK